MKRTKVDPESSHFRILRSVVIELQTKHDRQELTPVPVKGVKARFDKARKDLQKACRHKQVVELMSSWSPRKTPKAKFTRGRICLDCGLEEMIVLDLSRFYRVLPEPSFFANFSNLSKLKKLLENPTESKFVFRKPEDLLEENLKKEVAKVNS